MLMLPTYRNQSINLHSKSVDRFLYEGNTGLNVNSLLSKIKEMHCIAKLANATVTGLSETKLDNTVLNSELEIEVYDLVRFDLCGL